MTDAGAVANPCEAALATWCERWLSEVAADPQVGGKPIAVAFSGGADSTALLLAACQRWPQRVVALHVNHGLQAAAPLFQSQVESLCAELGIALRVVQVQAGHVAGQSPEDAARGARYAALSRMASEEGAACVLLGQHADDQAETLMLALSRGAGLPGLASMPERFERHGVVYGRPLLELPSGDLRAWLQCSGKPFLDDPSNTDQRFTRNRIRSVLLPAWERCFPGFRKLLARSARHAAQAQGLLDDLARIDMARVGDPPGIRELQGLSRERQANALRYWLRRSAGVAASTAQMEELLDQLADCRTRGHRLHIKVADGHVRRRADLLHYERSI